METVQTTSVNTWSAWDTALNNTMAFLPKLLGFVVVMVLGWIIVSLLAKALDKVLTRVGFDKAVSRPPLEDAMAKSSMRPAQIVGKIAFFAGLLFVMHIAFGMFGPNPVSDLLTRVIAFLPNVVVAVVMLVVAAQIAAFVKDILSATLGGLSYGRTLANIAALAIVVVGVFAAMTQLNIAPEIVLGLWYAMLAIVVGVSVVAIGGSGVMALRPRWDAALNRIDQEVPRMRDEVRMNKTMAFQPMPTDRPGGYAA